MVYQGEQTSLFFPGEQIECLVYILSCLIKACSVSQITVGCTELQTSLEKCTSLRSCSCLISLSPQRAQSYPQSWYAYRSIMYMFMYVWQSTLPQIHTPQWICWALHPGHRQVLHGSHFTGVGNAFACITDCECHVSFRLEACAGKAALTRVP